MLMSYTIKPLYLFLYFNKYHYVIHLTNQLLQIRFTGAGCLSSRKQKLPSVSQFKCSSSLNKNMYILFNTIQAIILKKIPRLYVISVRNYKSLGGVNFSFFFHITYPMITRSEGGEGQKYHWHNNTNGDVVALIKYCS